MVALVARWFSLLDVEKTAFLHHFHHLQVNSWTISILLFLLNPPCLVLHAKHPFGELSLLDGQVALVAQWFSLLDVAKTAFLAPFSLPTS